MNSKLTYNWGDNHLLIEIGNTANKRIKALFLAEFLFTSGMATIFLIQSFPLSQGFMNWISCIGASVLYMLAAYRFLSRMFSKEKLLLDADCLIIVNTTPFSKRVHRYSWKNIGPLHYAGKPEKTAHPLKGNCYDYFGFETQEQLIQNLHHDGNMYFNYAGFPVRFARGVYSWDAEEMVHMMKIFAGSRLRLGPEWKYMLQEHEWDDA